MVLDARLTWFGVVKYRSPAVRGSVRGGWSRMGRGFWPAARRRFRKRWTDRPRAALAHVVWYISRRDRGTVRSDPVDDLRSAFNSNRSFCRVCVPGCRGAETPAEHKPLGLAGIDGGDVQGSIDKIVVCKARQVCAARSGVADDLVDVSVSEADPRRGKAIALPEDHVVATGLDEQARAIAAQEPRDPLHH